MSFFRRWSLPLDPGAVVDGVLIGYANRTLAAFELFPDGAESLNLTGWNLNVVNGELITPANGIAEAWPKGPLTLEITNPKETPTVLHAYECNSVYTLAYLVELWYDVPTEPGDFITHRVIPVPPLQSIRETLNPTAPFLVLIVDKQDSGLQVFAQSLVTMRRGPSRLRVNRTTLPDAVE